ncbi:hypothetical protein [Peribacillus butanolivorans]|uniref:hypothetical protein n=1 Tax=Peribacillus butanolivorans TaxID=421767 RepID=UPI004063F766
MNTAADNIVKDYEENIQFAKTNESYWKGTALGTRIDLGMNNIEWKSHKQKRYNGFNDSEPIVEIFEEYWLALTYNEKFKRWIIVDVKDYYRRK